MNIKLKRVFAVVAAVALVATSLSVYHNGWLRASEEQEESDTQSESTQELQEITISDSADIINSEDSVENFNSQEENVVQSSDKKILITSNLDGTTEVSEGTSITLNAILLGYEGINYSIQWQKSLDGNNWIDEAGATNNTYIFNITSDNDDYLWRVIVTEL